MISVNSYQAARSNSPKEIRSVLKCRLYNNEIKSVSWVRLLAMDTATLLRLRIRVEILVD